MIPGQKETLASQGWTDLESLESEDHQEHQVFRVRWDRLAKKDIQDLQDSQGYQERKERLESWAILEPLAFRGFLGNQAHRGRGVTSESQE